MPKGEKARGQSLFSTPKYTVVESIVCTSCRISAQSKNRLLTPSLFEILITLQKEWNARKNMCQKFLTV